MITADAFTQLAAAALRKAFPHATVQITGHLGLDVTKPQTPAGVPLVIRIDLQRHFADCATKDYHGVIADMVSDLWIHLAPDGVTLTQMSLEQVSPMFRLTPMLLPQAMNSRLAPQSVSRPLPGLPFIRTTLSIDTPTTLVHVSSRMLPVWHISPEQALDLAAINVRALAASDPLHRMEIEGVGTIWATREEGERPLAGLEASRLIDLSQLVEQTGAKPGETVAVVVPRRDSLIAMVSPSPRDLWFLQTFAECELAEARHPLLHHPILVTDGEVRVAVVEQQERQTTARRAKAA